MAIPAKYFGLVPAGGFGTRFCGPKPKQYAQLGNQTVIEHSVQALLSDSRIGRVYVVCSEADAECEALFESESRVKVLKLAGQERVNTVLNALNYLLQNMLVQDTDWVLVHDAARPGLGKKQLVSLIDKGSDHVAGALLAIPLADTLKQGEMNEEGEVTSQITIPRKGLWCAQTPQMFRAQALSMALAECLYKGMNVTDEANAIETMGISPLIVQGGLRNMKITLPDDLAHVACLMGLQAQSDTNND
jgi:2-C-methyl-D-erythritol 4-phosphate cytidylyltransferase